MDGEDEKGCPFCYFPMQLTWRFCPSCGKRWRKLLLGCKVCGGEFATRTGVYCKKHLKESRQRHATGARLPRGVCRVCHGPALNRLATWCDEHYRGPEWARPIKRPFTAHAGDTCTGKSTGTL